MNYTIQLVQRGLSSNLHPVIGKSGKLYGQATASPEHKGVIFRLSLDDYQRDAHDLIGNTSAGQQWVPEIVPAVAENVPKKCGVCGKPAVAQWDKYFYCEEHAPNNATFFDARPQPVVAQPKVEAPQPEKLTPGIIEKHPGDEDLPQEELPAPAIGTAREEGTPETQTIGHVAPILQPLKTGDLQPPKPGEISKDSSRPAAVQTDKPSAKEVIETITAGVVSAIIPKLDAMVADKVANMAKTLRSGPKKPSKPPAPRPETEFTKLQKQAKSLGINSFGKNKEQLKQAIANV
jgi:hypothetical protein